MRLFCLSIAAVSTLTPLLALSDIEGSVLDASGRGIPGARVECGTRIVSADSAGAFRLEHADRCEAVVSAPGFERRKLILTSSRSNSVSLAVAGVAERIVVSATRYETTMEEAGVAASILSESDFRQRQYPGVADILREVPGLQVTRFGRHGGATQVFARGAQRTGTLLLIDGVAANDPGGDLNFAHFQSGSLERMEVVRGPGSPLFGADASAAVIQLATRRGNAEHRLPRGELAYERGSFQTDRWMVNLGGGSGGRLDYFLSAEQFHTAGEFPNDFYRNTTGAANLGLRLSDATQLRGALRVFDAQGGSPNRTAYRIYDFDANRADRDYNLSLRLDDVRSGNFLQHVAFGYHKLNDLFTDRAADGPYPLAGLLRDVPGPPFRTYLVSLVSLPAAVPAGLRLRSTTVRLTPLAEPALTATSRTSSEYQGTWTHSGGAAVFGYEYERQQGNISARDVGRNNHGLFLHEQRVVAGRLFLSGGVRLEQGSVFGTKFAPRGAASFRLSGATFFRLSAGRGITEPSLLQSFAREGTYIGNPGLRPEKTASYEAGLVREWLGRRMRTEMSAFHNSFRDLIVFVGSIAPALGTWENVEASWARGLEFSTQVRLLKGVNAGGSYTRLWTRITHSNSPTSPSTGIGQELMRRPAHSGGVWLSAAARRWFFQTSAVFMGERQDSDPLGVTRNPGYQHVSAGGSYRLHSHLSPFIRADNLLNSRYQEVLGYSSLSRSLRGGIRLEW